MIEYTPLFKYMKKKGMTGYKLTEIMGFSHSTWQNIVNGKSITVKTVNQLCTLLECDISDVLKYVETTEDKKLKREISKLI